MKHQLDRYLRDLRSESRLSANTMASYERDLLHFVSYAEQLGLADPDAVHKHHIAQYLQRQKGEGRMAATLSRRLVSIRAFFHYMAAEGWLRHNPALTIDSPKPEKKPPSVLTIDETNRLLEAPSADTAAGKRDRAMLELIYAGGIRVSELVALNLEHVNLQLGFIHCIGSGMKERIVPFGRMAKLALTDYLQAGRAELLTQRDANSAAFLNHLGTRLTRQGFWKTIKKYAKEAGIEAEITPHTLRHSVASHMLAGGADVRAVQELLGHADVATTLKYAQLPKTRMRDVYGSAHPRA
ncbi:site-specific tyrosine recombinase XerD [Paenibacillus arenilitoris]|uniref:Tyrosine recombinase XerC n=1 Tax=Paenibacillus arenilitoris TaxID=2772299 RepID=A0A927CN24_9BACL|nr:site-specific tyrosine recombinase XerD [Paenibacillus arenilitoris]MBD2869588.1 site-specific tyrosine recombinase XerD [Paenibacillus arenilitoris]